MRNIVRAGGWGEQLLERSKERENPDCARIIYCSRLFGFRLFVESGDTLTGGGIDVVGRLAQVNAVKMTVLAQPTWDDAQKAQYGLSGYYTAVTSAPAGIAFASQDFVTEGLYLAFGKQSKCGKALANPFSSGIAKLKADGTIDRIFARELERYEKTHPH